MALTAGVVRYSRESQVLWMNSTPGTWRVERPLLVLGIPRWVGTLLIMESVVWGYHHYQPYWRSERKGTAGLGCSGSCYYIIPTSYSSFNNIIIFTMMHRLPHHKFISLPLPRSLLPDHLPSPFHSVLYNNYYTQYNLICPVSRQIRIIRKMLFIFVRQHPTSQGKKVSFDNKLNIYY